MKLIIINGPCGVGKTSAVLALHDTMPLSYLVDVDAIGRNISHYREYRKERWELRDAVASATVDTVLRIGRDVILEKMMFWPELLEAHEKIAKTHGAEMIEIILWAPKEVVMKRADDRGWREGGLLTPKRCEEFWTEVDVFKDARPNAIIIDTSELNQKEVLKAVKKAIK